MGDIDNVLAGLKTLLERGTKVDVAAGTALLQPSTWMFGHGMFSHCGGNELISTLVTDDAMTTWLGSRGSIEDPYPTKLLGWVGPEGTGAGSITWERTGACTEPPGVEYGKCELLACFGEVAAKGADLSLLRLGLKGCSNEPRYYVRGPHASQVIGNERDWQLSLASFVIRQMVERMNIVGNRVTNPLHWDGLQRLINAPVIDYRTGLRCQDAEPIIYDWASAAMSNNICDVINSIVRRIRHRARQFGGIERGDMAIVLTQTMADALIDWQACGCGPCSGAGSFAALPVGNVLETRKERARLANGGTFGMGMIEVDGIPVDFIVNDWIPQTSSAPYFCSDIYILTRRAGGGSALAYHYQDLAWSLSGIPVDRLAQGAQVTDGGRFLVLSQNVHECFSEEVYMKGRLVLSAPHLQARITNVCAPFNIEPEVPIPGDAYFFAGDPPTNAAAYASLPYTFGNCGGSEDW